MEQIGTDVGLGLLVLVAVFGVAMAIRSWRKNKDT